MARFNVLGDRALIMAGLDTRLTVVSVMRSLVEGHICLPCDGTRCQAKAFETGRGQSMFLGRVSAVVWRKRNWLHLVFSIVIYCFLGQARLTPPVRFF